MGIRSPRNHESNDRSVVWYASMPIVDDDRGKFAAEPPVRVAEDPKDGSVAVVTLNRQDRPNTLTTELKEALVEAVERTGADTGVRAVVLTGSGKAFCVGQDLGEHAEALRTDPATAFDTVEKHYNPIVAGLAGMPKPVV